MATLKFSIPEAAGTGTAYDLGVPLVQLAEKSIVPGAPSLIMHNGVIEWHSIPSQLLEDARSAVKEALPGATEIVES